MALVRKIIPQSTVDGKGNRTAIFLQGCNIRCAYCHNPETQSFSSSEATEMSAEEVSQQVLSNLPFIRGITVSGGECMLQTAFLTDLFRHIKTAAPHLSCLIDSNGTIDFGQHTYLMQLTDGVMLDIKAWEDDVYSSLTGLSAPAAAQLNQTVKRNLHYLLKNNLLTEIRIVCLPQESYIQTDVEDILHQLALCKDIIDQHIPVYLIRFRPNGVKGELSQCPTTTNELLSQYLSLAQQLHLNAFIRG